MSEITSYTVRKPGYAAYATGIETAAEAARLCNEANKVCEEGHIVLAEYSDGSTKRVDPPVIEL